MAFIRHKRSSAGTVYQVVRSYRDGGRVRQQVLCSLGRWATVEAALAYERKQLAAAERLTQLPGSEASPWLAQQLTAHRARVAQLETVQRDYRVA
jgi:hypothetical protein